MGYNIDGGDDSDVGEEGASTQYATVASHTLEELMSGIGERIKLLAEKERNWVEVEKRMRTNIDVANKKITLDIGGKLFATSKSTLLAYPGSFFEAMLSCEEWKPGRDGAYFIDRCPKLFPVLLDYLRMGKVNVKMFAYDVMADLKDEFDFYQIALPEEAIPIMAFDGSKLLNQSQKRQLIAWLGKEVVTSHLYSATRDGFGAAQFHLKCDNKGATVVIASTTTGSVFGGYTPTSWDSTGSYKMNTSTFLFTLENNHKIPPTRYNATTNNNAIYCHALYGPTFGTGHDIHICNNSNSTNTSYSNFPSTFGDTTGKGLATFAGSYNFLLTELEVFQVV